MRGLFSLIHKNNAGTAKVPKKREKTERDEVIRASVDTAWPIQGRSSAREQAGHVGPELLPGQPFLLGEPGEEQLVADADQGSLRLPELHRK